MGAPGAKEDRRGGARERPAHQTVLRDAARAGTRLRFLLGHHNGRDEVERLLTATLQCFPRRFERFGEGLDRRLHGGAGAATAGVFRRGLGLFTRRRNLPGVFAGFAGRLGTLAVDPADGFVRGRKEREKPGRFFGQVFKGPVGLRLIPEKKKTSYAGVERDLRHARLRLEPGNESVGQVVREFGKSRVPQAKPPRNEGAHRSEKAFGRDCLHDGSP